MKIQTLRIGITGHSGSLGKEFKNFFSSKKIITEDINKENFDLSCSYNLEHLNDIFSGFDCIIHCGAITPRADQAFNLETYMNGNLVNSLLLSDWAAFNNKKLVLFGTTTKLNERSNNSSQIYYYLLSKILFDKTLLSTKDYVQNILHIKASSIYGPYQLLDKLIQSTIIKSATNQPIEISNPENLTNLVFSGDIVEAVIYALNNNKFGEYTFSSKEHHKIRDVVMLAADKNSNIKFTTNNSHNNPIFEFQNVSSNYREILRRDLTPLNTGIENIKEYLSQNNII